MMQVVAAQDHAAPAMPANVAATFASYPLAVSSQLAEVRRLIFAVAAEAEGVGPLTETLKWGEPAYLTERTKSGSTIRLGPVAGLSDRCAVLFNCNTTLVEDFRAQFADALAFSGNRAIVLRTDTTLPDDPLRSCIRMALTYHRARKQRAR